MTTPAQPAPASRTGGQGGGDRRPAGGKKILGMEPTLFYLSLGGASVVVGLLWYWRKQQAAKAAAASSDGSTSGDATALDNSTADGPDEDDLAGAGNLAAIQGELAYLLANQGGDTATTTGTATADPATVTGTPKTAPDPISVSVTASGTDISWPPVGGSTKYQIQIEQNGVLKENSTVNATHAVYSSATLKKGSYTYKMRAGNANGWGPWSPVRTFKIS